MISLILECDVFPDNASRLSDAAKKAGHEVIEWKDDWLSRRSFPKPSSNFCVFHGSLGNAAQIRQATDWKPGSYCNVDSFNCSSWYPTTQPWLLQKKHSFTTVRQLVDNPHAICAQLESEGSVFVRPDSPLKPFSGRLLETANISLRSLDHGFYYEDENLPIVVCQPTEVSFEWRFIVCDSQVIAGSEYSPEGRKEGACITKGEQWQLAQSIATQLQSPDPLYVLDVCLSKGKLHLLELNPFSGADLYACDRTAIVSALESLSQKLA